MGQGGWIPTSVDILIGKDGSLEKLRADLGGVCEKLEVLGEQGT